MKNYYDNFFILEKDKLHIYIRGLIYLEVISDTTMILVSL